MAQIELINLTKIYTVGAEQLPATQDVSLVIDKGEFLTFVGHSGSGKTTLISMIGGILRPTSGKVLFEGNDIFALDDDGLSEFRNKNIGFMFQFASLLPILTAMENVLLPGVFSQKPLTYNSEKAQRYLELVGLGDKYDAYPSQLSGGQQRRVAIARGLINEPDVILADEPTGDLDEETEAEIMSLFGKINQEKKVTIILITHNLELAKQGNKIMRMTKGVLVNE